MSKYGSNHSDSRSIYIEIINEPPAFNISVTDSIIAERGVYTFEEDTPAPEHYRLFDKKYDPSGWIDYSYFGGDVRVKKVNDGIHNNVMELSSKYYRGYSLAKNDFNPQISGVIEFWFKKAFGNPNKGSNQKDDGLFIRLVDSKINPDYFNLYQAEKNATVDILINEYDNNKILYHDGYNYKELDFQIYDPYEWMHLKIDFNCTEKSYNLYFNGFLIGENLPFRYNMSEVNSLIFLVNTKEGNNVRSIGGYYIDSIGYDWDENYSEGDNFAYTPKKNYNFYEDQSVYLFITDLSDYTSQISDLRVIWNMGDGFQKEGGLGILYRWTEDAVYNISATIIDNLNAIHSECINLEIKNKKPEANFKYSVDMPSSINFNKDAAGASPTGWMIYDGSKYLPKSWFEVHNLSSDIICNPPEVEEWFEGFYKVIKFEDYSDLDFSAMQHKTPRNQFGYGIISYGSFEFWFYTTDINKDFQIYGFSNETVKDSLWRYIYGWDSYQNEPYIGGVDLYQKPDGFIVRLKNGIWQYSYKNYIDDYNGIFWSFKNFTGLQKMESNKWYHIRIDFNANPYAYYDNLSVGQIQININGVSSNIGNWQEYKSFEFIDYIGFMTGVTESGYSCYIDSLGFSWDENYELGDNWKVFRDSYKGTYDFRFEPHDQFPSEYKNIPWYENNAEDCSSEIIVELDGHYDVLKISDYNSSGSAELYNLLIYKQPEYGTAEFWFRSEDVSKIFEINLGPLLFGKGIKIRTHDYKWEYLDKSSGTWLQIPNVKPPINNQWQHIRLDFECRHVASYSGYMGLSEDTFRVIIDNELDNASSQLNLINNLGAMQILGFKSGFEDSDFSVYLDAIGYSWDPAYKVGQNLVPKRGYFDKSAIIFTASGDSDTKSDYNSLRYYWLFGDNKTGFGRGTIHEYEKSGIYNVTLIIEDDNGAIDIHSEEIIVDNTPPRVKILPPFHKATYNFKNDEIGSWPEGWERGFASFGSELNSSIVIEQELDDHRNVMHFQPVSRASGAYIGELPVIGNIFNFIEVFRQNFSYTEEELKEKYNPNPFNQSFGTIEFYLYIENSSNSFTIILTQSILFLIFFAIFDGIFLITVNGSWYYYQMPTTFEEVADYMKNPIRISRIPLMNEKTWNHIRIDWACDDSGYMDLSEDTFRLTVNGISSNALPMNNVNFTAFLASGSNESNFENPYKTLWPESLNAINLINFIGSIEDTKSGFYIDAVGLSWDPDYEIGDNLKDPYEINEGDSFYFETCSYEGSSDYVRLEYYWGRVPEFGIKDFANTGWTWTYTWFDDSYLDETLVYVYDSEGIMGADYNAKKINVNNVPPDIGIYTAYIPCNITLDFWTNKPSKEADFEFKILRDGETIYAQNITKPSGVQTLTLQPIEFGFELSKNYEIILNQTYRQDTDERYRIEATITIDYIYNGNYYSSSVFTHKFRRRNYVKPWILDPNQWWVDNREYMLSYPLRFYGSFYDPSNDDINLDIDYGLEWTYKVSHNNETMVEIPVEINKTIYNFENDAVGSKPSEWNTYKNVSIIQTEYPHSKVVEVHDNSKSDMSAMYQFFEAGPQNYGIINLSVMVSNFPESSDDAILMIEPISLIGEERVEFIPALAVAIFNNSWYLVGVNASGKLRKEFIKPAKENRWYSIKIEFEYTDGNYSDLNRGMCRVSIDNTISNDIYTFNYINSTSHNIEGIIIASMEDNSDPYCIYVDDIIYSWDSDQTKLIPTGNATYNFSGDLLGALPSEWLDYYSYPIPINTISNSVTVQEESSAHGKYVLLRDDNIENSSLIFNEFNHNQSYGTVEFWLKYTFTGNEGKYPVLAAGLATFNGTTTVLSGALYGKVGSWYTLLENDKFAFITEAYQNKWYHCRIDFELTDGNYTGLIPNTMRITVNNIYSKIINISLHPDPSARYVNQFFVFTYPEYTGIEVYLDDVGYSWDPNYNVGDNVRIKSKVFYDHYKKSFLINGITYNVELWEDKSGEKYAKINLLKNCYDNYYSDNNFPVDKDFYFDIEPFDNSTEDIYHLLTDIVGLENLTIISKINSRDFIKLIASDDDGGNTVKYFYIDTNPKWPTYSFDDEFAGKSGAALDFVEKLRSDGNCTVKLVYDAERDGNVLMIKDNDSSEKLVIKNYFDEVTEGTISFWWKVSDVNKVD
ncbi:MAG: PKD domain-containing protein [Promethearchaeota archaeon]